MNAPLVWSRPVAAEGKSFPRSLKSGCNLPRALMAKLEFLRGLSEECGVAWLTWNSSRLYGWFEVKICWFGFGEATFRPGLDREELLIKCSFTGEPRDQALILSSNWPRPTKEFTRSYSAASCRSPCGVGVSTRLPPYFCSGEATLELLIRSARASFYLVN